MEAATKPPTRKTKWRKPLPHPPNAGSQSDSTAATGEGSIGKLDRGIEKQLKFC